MGKTQKNEFNISGKVVWVGMPIFISDKMKKRILILEVWVFGKYRREVQFNFMNENMDLLNNIRPNDWVNVDWFINSNKQVQSDGKPRWYTNLEGTTCVKQD
jgi:hypothetical protein